VVYLLRGGRGLVDRLSGLRDRLIIVQLLGLGSQLEGVIAFELFIAM
jgi:hypothetical protein